MPLNDTTNEIPFGYCRCNCGQKTTVAPHTDKRRGWVRGEPIRYIQGHNGRIAPVVMQPKYCECGCGQITPISKRRDSKRGLVKGQHARFCKGHRLPSTAEEVFWKNVIPGPFDQCWQWQGTLEAAGYGTISHGNKHLRAHRISYELHFGTIPNGMEICHHCDRPSCVNPYHLFLGTHADNMHDMIQKGRHKFSTRRGEKQWMSKLKTADIIAIRHLATQGIKIREIANQFQISKDHIRRVIKRECWAHIP